MIKPPVVNVVVVPIVVVELQDVIVLLHVVHATLAGDASPTNALNWPAMFSNPIPTTGLELAIMAFALAISDAAIC